MRERGHENASLQRALRAALDGRGQALLVEGGAGMGKTRLLTETRTSALAGEFDVFTARGGELEGDYAFGIVRQLFEAPLAAATAEDRRQLFSGPAELSASLFSTAPTTASPGGGDSSFAMLHGLYWLAANAASRRPSLVVVDDLHWTDEPSIRWLVYLARRLEGLPLLLLLGTRPAEPTGSPRVLAELMTESSLQILRLASLGEGSAADLARVRLMTEPQPEFAAALHVGSGGNPLYLSALLDAVAQRGTPPTAEHSEFVLTLAPSVISRSVAARLARLSDDATVLVRAAAILGDRADLRLAASLGDMDTAAGLVAAGALVRSDLLRSENPVEFIHPVVRSVVLDGMSAGDRVAMHRRAAEALLDSGVPLDQVAGHLTQTLPGGDPFVVRTLRRAAVAAMAQGAPDAAVVYLRRALAEATPAQERAELLFELGAALANTDAVQAAELLHEAIEQLVDPAVRTKAVLAYVHVLNLFGRRADEAADLLLAAIESLGEDNAELRNQLDAMLMIGCRYDVRFSGIATKHWLSRREHMHDVGAEGGLLLIVAAIEEALDGESRAAAVDYGRRAMSSDVVRSRDRIYLTSALAALAMAGRVDEALAGFERVIDAGQRSGDHVSVAGHQLWRSLVHYERGELLLAEEDLVLDGTPFWRSTTTLAYRAGFLSQILLERGQVDDARTLVDAIELDEVQDAHRLHYLFARARLAFETDDAEHALAEFVRAGRLADALEFHNPAFIPWRSQGALALYRLGRTDEAHDWAAEELQRSLRWGAPRTVGVSLAALGVVEGGAAGRASLVRAVAVLAQSSARLEHARALIDLGAALRRGNDRSEARRMLREGSDLAQRCGAVSLVRRANDELAATGLHPRAMVLAGADALTASERRVASMAARDLSNKEIAQALFVTVKTVEQHLGRVYRKLDITSRRNLADALRYREDLPSAAV